MKQGEVGELIKISSESKDGEDDQRNYQAAVTCESCSDKGDR